MGIPHRNKVYYIHVMCERKKIGMIAESSQDLTALDQLVITTDKNERKRFPSKMEAKEYIDYLRELNRGTEDRPLKFYTDWFVEDTERYYIEVFEGGRDIGAVSEKTKIPCNSWGCVHTTFSQDKFVLYKDKDFAEAVCRTLKSLNVEWLGKRKHKHGKTGIYEDITFEIRNTNKDYAGNGTQATGDTCELVQTAT